MRKYITLFFSGLLFLLACHKGPEGIIKPDVMANVLTEVHLTDGDMLNIPQIPDSIYRYGMARYLQIFKKYGVDSAQFNKSYKYYALHAEEMNKIYDQVMKKLQAQSDSVSGIIAKNNTTQIKSTNKSVVPVGGGKFIQPGAAAPHPGGPNSGTLKEQMLQKLKMHRDSMQRRNLNKKNAVPVQ